MMEWDGFLLSHFFSLISQAEKCKPYGNFELESSVCDVSE